MNRHSLVVELVERWEDRIRQRPWPERVRLFQDIHDKLYEDLASREIVEEVFSALVASIVDHLGEQAVTCQEQASVFAASANPHHRALAASWRSGKSEALREEDRRRAHRVPVNVPAQLNLENNWVPCRIVDLSTGGALIDTTVMLAVGRELQLALPDQGVARATVVRVAGETMRGLAFKDRHPLHHPEHRSIH